MVSRFAGRSQATVLVVLAALLSIVDVSSKAMAPWLQRVKESASVAALFGVKTGASSPSMLGAWVGTAAIALLMVAFGTEPEHGVLMGTAVTQNWQDLLDIRFARLYNQRYKQLPDMLARFFRVVGPGDSPQRATWRSSSAGEFGDVPEFNGTVTYDDAYQGYDVTVTPKQYASGFQVERIAFDHDEYGILDKKPKGLATASQRSRQKRGAQVFNNATSVDTTWLSNTENVALASNSHTTTAPGVSTSTGFDNLVTTAFSATALAAARIQMVNFRDDRANRIAINPSLIIHPPDIYDQVHEVVRSEGNPETANNAANVHYNAYQAVEWFYLNDVNNWGLADETMMKDSLVMYDELSPEFAMVESFDDLIGKWRLYERYGFGHDDWRWLLWAQVS